MNESNDQATPSKVQKLTAKDNRLHETQKALEDIDSCQTEIDILNEKASEEILQVEQKYNKLRKPHFEKRNDLINNIPNFWVTAFINHPRLSSVVHVEEEECLHHLSQLEVEEHEDIKSGYVIRFHFSSNPFFTNDVLTKEFRLGRGSAVSTSTEIQWKDNMNLITRAARLMTSRKRRRGGGRSFFSWFKSSVETPMDSIAEVLKDDLWPNPLQYYLSPDVEANGLSDDDDDMDSNGASDDSLGFDDSIVVVGDDDDDDDEDDDDNIYSDVDDVYEVDDDDEEDLVRHQWTTIDTVGADSDDAIEVLDSDGEAEAMNAAADGLDSSFDTIDTSHLLVDSSHEVIDSTQEIIDTSQEAVDISAAETTREIADTSKEADISQEIADTSQEIADTSQEIADTSQEKADTSQEKADTSQEIADISQEIADTSQEKADTSQEIADTSQEIAKAPQEAADTTCESADTTQETVEESGDTCEDSPSVDKCPAVATEGVGSEGAGSDGKDTSGMDVSHSGDTEEEVDEGVEEELLKDDSDSEAGGGAGE